MTNLTKHHDDLLNKKENPNFSIVLKQSDMQLDNYLDQHMRNRQKQDEYIHNLKESIRKKRIMETQNIQRLQMAEREHISKMSKDHDRKFAKDIISKDLKDININNDSDGYMKKLKQLEVKEMLDSQIQKDQQVKVTTFGLENREYALNASKIRDVINRY